MDNDQAYSNAVARFYEEQWRFREIQLSSEELKKHRPENKQFNVLLVEDTCYVLNVLKFLMEKFNYNYDTATNGLEAFDKFKAGKFDLIMMDIGMHPVNGIEATKLIKSYENDQGCGHVPIIAQTGFGTYAMVDCYAAGIDAILIKPYAPPYADFDYIENMLFWFTRKAN